VIDSGNAKVPEGGAMSLGREEDKRVARAEEEKDEVEAHGVGREMTDEPKADDDSDDFEAHSIGRE
jgi:hypothetical protein